MFNPHNASFSHLLAACMAERDAYLRKESDASPVCLATLHAALHDHSDLHWEVFYTCFAPAIEKRVRRHRVASFLLQYETAEAYVQESFLVFHRTSLSRELTFPTFAAALHYLLCCLNSVMMRSWHNHHGMALHELTSEIPEDGGIIEHLHDRLDCEQLWRRILGLLATPQERALAVLMWRDALRPREIMQRFPQIFPSVEAIYRTRALVVRHLRRHLGEAQAA